MPKYTVPHNTFEAFKNEVLHKEYDYDGAPPEQPYQCWDGVQLLYDQYGETLATGRGYGGTSNAYECWANMQARAHNTTKHFTPQVTLINLVKKGDVVVFNPWGQWIGPTGHIGFACHDYDGTGKLTILGQNQNGVPEFTEWEFPYASLAFIGGWHVAEWYNKPEPTEKKEKKKFPWFILSNRLRKRNML